MIQAVDASPGSARLVCDWCGGPMPTGRRRDAETCSKSCRQARHRFTVATGSPIAVTAGQPRRLAYADPPYPGLSARYYGDHPDYAGEVDHADLIARLGTFDAWALSTSARALPDVLALCPPGVRVAAWVRGVRHNSRATMPENGWEPVIYAGRLVAAQASGPARGDGSADDEVEESLRTGTTRRVDTLIYPARPRTTDPDPVIGAKPAAFAGWLFRLLAATPNDTLDDLYPGSRGIGRAWSIYSGRPRP